MPFRLSPLCPKACKSAAWPRPVCAQSLIARYCDHLPLYRQEQIYRTRHGVSVPRQSMARWVGLAAPDLRNDSRQSPGRRLCATPKSLQHQIDASRPEARLPPFPLTRSSVRAQLQTPPAGPRQTDGGYVMKPRFDVAKRPTFGKIAGMFVLLTPNHRAIVAAC